VGLNRISIGPAVMFSFFLLSSLLVPFVFGSEENWNWIEVEKITGDNYELFETEPFNISSSVSVWRIVWQYEPRTDVPEDQTGLTINVYAGVSDEDRLIIISRRGIHNGDEQTRYFHEQGVFHLEISSNTQNFSVRVEKSIGYTPEPSKDNWVEVTRFIGSKGYTTNAFDCDYDEWRIRWEFNPGHWHFPELYTLKINTYKMGMSTAYNQIIVPPNGNLNGVELLHQSGTFYMKIDTGLSDCYTIIVEQNTNSSPKLENNWVEVSKFSGDGAFFGSTLPANELFNVSHSDWRIKWEYEIYIQNLTAFFFDVKLAGTNQTVAGYSNSGQLNIQKGILNITEYTGEFYLYVGTNAKSYTITVEENIDSIPEFPSMTILFAGLSLITLISIIYRHKPKQEKKR
jgi:hypothetical protein